MMEDADIHSMWLTLERLSSIIENAHNKGPLINGVLERPTMTFKSKELDWINTNDTDPYSVSLQTKNGPTLRQKKAVLDELKSEVANMKADITKWKRAYANRDRRLDKDRR